MLNTIWFTDQKCSENGKKLLLHVSTYISTDSSSGATRMDDPNLCFIAKIVQCEDFLLIL